MKYDENFKKVLLSGPHCIVGKKFQTNQSEIIKHVNKLLKRYKVIKIKVLKAALYDSNIKEIAQIITNATNSYLLDLRGKILIISNYQMDKKKKK